MICRVKAIGEGFGYSNLQVGYCQLFTIIFLIIQIKAGSPWLVNFCKKLINFCKFYHLPGQSEEAFRKTTDSLKHFHLGASSFFNKVIAILL